MPAGEVPSFIGAGNVNLIAAGGFLSTVATVNVLELNQTQVGGRIEVEYAYTALRDPHIIPEPGSLALFGTGLVGAVFGGSRRRRREDEEVADVA